MAGNSQLEEMLKKDDCTVDKLLEGEYLSDLKNQNEKLIE